MFTLNGDPIKVFNYGKHRRDFTYIDDIVEGILRVLYNPAKPNQDWRPENPDASSSKSPWRIYNIGNQIRVELMDYIAALEKPLGREAVKELLPLQPGDVPDTYADVSKLARDTGYTPSTSVEDCVNKFVEWYTNYYGIS